MVARVARACDDNVCTHLLVRGDQIEFISVEQARKVGCGPVFCPTALNERAMPSDIKLPRDFVLVHDTTGEVFPRCELFVVRWRGNGGRASEVRGAAAATAREYFGGSSNYRVGSVEVPRDVRWRQVARVQLIRYRRHGFVKGFEHRYDPAVMLYGSERPLAWRLALPDGCIVNAHGFVRP